MPIAYLVRGPKHAIAVESRVIRSTDIQTLMDGTAVIQACESVVAQVEEEGARRYEAACARGLEDGRRLALERCGQHLAHLESCVAGYLAALDETLVGLAVEIVRRIAPRLGSEALVAAWIVEAAGAMKGEQLFRVRVHPCDLATIRAQFESARDARLPCVLIEFVEDASMEPYACIMESDCAVIRTDLDGQLDAIRSTLVEAVAPVAPVA